MEGSCQHGYWRDGEHWSHYFNFYDTEKSNVGFFSFRGFKLDDKERGLMESSKGQKIKLKLQFIFNAP